MNRYPGTPLFLERRSYRFRRLMDSVRMLPFIVLSFWMVPLLWPVHETVTAESVPMSHALRYVFGAWLAAVILCFVLWRRTSSQIEQETQR